MTHLPRSATAIRSNDGSKGRFWASPQVALCAFAASILLAATPAPLGAQDSYTRALKAEVERLQQDLLTLQRQVYRSGGSSGSSGGSSDLAPTQAARLELRMSQFEDALRRLTGRSEELAYQINQASSRMEEMAATLSQRIDRLEAGGQTWSQVPQDQGETTLGAAAAPPASPQGTTLGSTQSNELSQGQVQAGTAPGPQTLGTISAADLETLRAQALQLQQGGAAASQGTAQGSTQSAAQANLQTAALPGNTAKEKYDYAFGLLSQANYPAAEEALQAFLQQHPGDPLAGNAKYWLGETFYVRQLYKQAAVAFAEGFQQYPTSNKAPDNLLKLGKSLSALGQVQDACGTHAELLNRFPSAPATILQQAKSERQRLSCS